LLPRTSLEEFSVPDVISLDAVSAAIDPSVMSVRQPRGMVRINGQQVPGWIEWEVESNAYREADTFHVTFALSVLVAPFDEAWFASQTTIGVEILAGFPADPDNF